MNEDKQKSPLERGYMEPFEYEAIEGEEPNVVLTSRIPRSIKDKEENFQPLRKEDEVFISLNGKQITHPSMAEFLTVISKQVIEGTELEIVEAVEAMRKTMGAYTKPPYWAGTIKHFPLEEAADYVIGNITFIVALNLLASPEDKEAFINRPLGEVLYPIGLYKQKRNLPVKEAIPKQSREAELSEAQLLQFLAFFLAYWKEWLALDEAERSGEDIGDAQRKVMRLLVKQGIMPRKRAVKGQVIPASKGRKGEVIPATENILGDITALGETLLFVSLLHGPGLDEITKLDRKTEIQKNPITGTAYATVGNMTIQHKRGINVGPPAKRKAVRKELTKEEEALLFQKYISTVATTAALKLLDISAIKLTEQNGYRASKYNTNVEMDVTEYMEKCGIPLTIPSTKKTKGILKGILEAFNAITLDFQEKRAGRDGENWHLNILQKYEDNMANGKIKLQFTEDIAEYLTGAYLAHFPMPLLKTDERNDNVYRIGRRLMLHYSNVYNQEQGTADIISVKALLESAPSIRTYEEVMAAKGDRHLEVSIMRPFKTALDKLDFIEWEYCNAKKAPLTKKQKAEFDYHTFIGCYVKFTVLNGPDMKKIVAAKQEKKAQAEAKKKARAEARKKADA